MKHGFCLKQGFLLLLLALFLFSGCLSAPSAEERQQCINLAEQFQPEFKACDSEDSCLQAVESAFVFPSQEFGFYSEFSRFKRRLASSWLNLNQAAVEVDRIESVCRNNNNWLSAIESGIILKVELFRSFLQLSEANKIAFEVVEKKLEDLNSSKVWLVPVEPVFDDFLRLNDELLALENEGILEGPAFKKSFVAVYFSASSELELLFKQTGFLEQHQDSVSAFIFSASRQARKHLALIDLNFIPIDLTTPGVELLLALENSLAWSEALERLNANHIEKFSEILTDFAGVNDSVAKRFVAEMKAIEEHELELEEKKNKLHSALSSGLVFFKQPSFSEESIISLNEIEEDFLQLEQASQLKQISLFEFYAGLKEIDSRLSDLNAAELQASALQAGKQNALKATEQDFDLNKPALPSAFDLTKGDCFNYLQAVFSADTGIDLTEFRQLFSALESGEVEEEKQAIYCINLRNRLIDFLDSREEVNEILLLREKLNKGIFLLERLEAIDSSAVNHSSLTELNSKALKFEPFFEGQILDFSTALPQLPYINESLKELVFSSQKLSETALKKYFESSAVLEIFPSDAVPEPSKPLNSKLSVSCRNPVFELIEQGFSAELKFDKADELFFVQGSCLQYFKAENSKLLLDFNCFPAQKIELFFELNSVPALLEETQSIESVDSFKAFFKKSLKVKSSAGLPALKISSELPGNFLPSSVSVSCNGKELGFDLNENELVFVAEEVKPSQVFEVFFAVPNPLSVFSELIFEKEEQGFREQGYCLNIENLLPHELNNIPLQFALPLKNAEEIFLFDSRQEAISFSLFNNAIGFKLKGLLPNEKTRHYLLLKFKANALKWEWQGSEIEGQLLMLSYSLEGEIASKAKKLLKELRSFDSGNEMEWHYFLNSLRQKTEKLAFEEQLLEEEKFSFPESSGNIFLSDLNSFQEPAFKKTAAEDNELFNVFLQKSSEFEFLAGDLLPGLFFELEEELESVSEQELFEANYVVPLSKNGLERKKKTFSSLAEQELFQELNDLKELIQSGDETALIKVKTFLPSLEKKIVKARELETEVNAAIEKMRNDSIELFNSGVEKLNSLAPLQESIDLINKAEQELKTGYFLLAIKDVSRAVALSAKNQPQEFELPLSVFPIIFAVAAIVLYKFGRKKKPPALKKIPKIE